MIETIVVLVFCTPIVVTGLLAVIESIRDDIFWSRMRKESEIRSNKRYLAERIADKERDLFGY